MSFSIPGTFEEESLMLRNEIDENFVIIPQPPTTEEEMDAEYDFVSREESDEYHEARGESCQLNSPSSRMLAVGHESSRRSTLRQPAPSQKPPAARKAEMPACYSTLISASGPQAVTSTLKPATLMPTFRSPRAIRKVSKRASSTSRTIAPSGPPAGRASTSVREGLSAKEAGFSDCNDIALERVAPKLLPRPKHSNSVLGGKLKAKDRPIRQPNLPPDVENLKSDAGKNFCWKEDIQKRFQERVIGKSSLY